MRLQTIKLQKGFGIVESMLAAMILLFVLSSGFIILNNALINIALDNKSEELSSALDDRVSVYRLTGVFDDSPTKGGIKFKKTVVVRQKAEVESAKKDAVNRFKPLGAADIKKMAEKKAESTSKSTKIVYKILNIAAFDDNMKIADRVKVVERIKERNDSDKK